MPTLKQITCQIELTPSNVKLREYECAYGDGYVEAFVAVPDEPVSFCIHLKSTGYIAPGLAMFVFMDGVYQCNRNRRGLKIPDANTPTHRTEVEFRVRQKEERHRGQQFIGREWRFEKVNVASADASSNTNSDFLGNVGTIEVIVLRCHDRPPEIPPRHPRVSSNSILLKNSQKFPSTSEEARGLADLSGLFDGAGDDSQEQCYGTGLDGHFDPKGGGQYYGRGPYHNQHSYYDPSASYVAPPPPYHSYGRAHKSGGRHYERTPNEHIVPPPEFRHDFEEFLRWRQSRRVQPSYGDDMPERPSYAGHSRRYKMPHGRAETIIGTPQPHHVQPVSSTRVEPPTFRKLPQTSTSPLLGHSTPTPAPHPRRMNKTGTLEVLRRSDNGAQLFEESDSLLSEITRRPREASRQSAQSAQASVIDPGYGSTLLNTSQVRNISAGDEQFLSHCQERWATDGYKRRNRYQAEDETSSILGFEAYAPDNRGRPVTPYRSHAANMDHQKQEQHPSHRTSHPENHHANKKVVVSSSWKMPGAWYDTEIIEVKEEEAASVTHSNRVGNASNKSRKASLKAPSQTSRRKFIFTGGFLDPGDENNQQDVQNATADWVKATNAEITSELPKWGGQNDSEGQDTNNTSGGRYMNNDTGNFNKPGADWGATDAINKNETDAAKDTNAGGWNSTNNDHGQTAEVPVKDNSKDEVWGAVTGVSNTDNTGTGWGDMNDNNNTANNASSGWDIMTSNNNATAVTPVVDAITTEWDIPDNVNDTAVYSTDCWNNASQPTTSEPNKEEHKPAGSCKSSSTKFIYEERNRSVAPLQEPLTKSYWTSWNARPSGSPYPESFTESVYSKTFRSHNEQIDFLPEEPAPAVSQAVAEEKKVEHQVRTGRGSTYRHRTGRPAYIDSMDKPYAVFRFKYRSNEMLKQILGVEIEVQEKENEEHLKEKMMELSKEELVCALLKAKMQPESIIQGPNIPLTPAGANDDWEKKTQISKQPSHASVQDPQTSQQSWEKKSQISLLNWDKKSQISQHPSHRSAQAAQQQAADPAAELRAIHVVAPQPIKVGSEEVEPMTCDQCGDNLGLSWYHCDRCNEAERGYNTCMLCVTNGKRCKDESHDLDEWCENKATGVPGPTGEKKLATAPAATEGWAVAANDTGAQDNSWNTTANDGGDGNGGNDSWGTSAGNAGVQDNSWGTSANNGGNGGGDNSWGNVTGNNDSAGGTGWNEDNDWKDTSGNDNAGEAKWGNW